MRGNGYGSYRALKIKINCIQSMIALYRIAISCFCCGVSYTYHCTFFSVLTAARSMYLLLHVQCTYCCTYRCSVPTVG